MEDVVLFISVILVLGGGFLAVVSCRELQKIKRNMGFLDGSSLLFMLLDTKLDETAITYEEFKRNFDGIDESIVELAWEIFQHTNEVFEVKLPSLEK